MASVLSGHVGLLKPPPLIAGMRIDMITSGGGKGQVEIDAIGQLLVNLVVGFIVGNPIAIFAVCSNPLGHGGFIGGVWMNIRCDAGGGLADKPVQAVVFPGEGLGLVEYAVGVGIKLFRSGHALAVGTDGIVEQGHEGINPCVILQRGAARGL